MMVVSFWCDMCALISSTEGNCSKTDIPASTMSGYACPVLRSAPPPAGRCQLANAMSCSNNHYCWRFELPPPHSSTLSPPCRLAAAARMPASCRSTLP